jgi:general L-amino acid transport system substrate-binding protein
VNRFGTCLALATALAITALPAKAGELFEAIKKRDEIRCGVGTGMAGFGTPTSDGSWNGFNIDLCRAVAAGILGDGAKVAFVPLTNQQRFPAVKTGEVDMLSNNSTLTLTRVGKLGLSFSPVVFYDGQGMMVAKAAGVEKGEDLSGAVVCVQPGGTTELNVTDFFRSRNIPFSVVVIESLPELRQAFFGGRCDAYANDTSQLAAERSIAANPEDYVVLPTLISKEPLALVVADDDRLWANAVAWTVNALIEAEELGITSANVDTFEASDNPAIRRFLGLDPLVGEALQLDDKFAHRIIKTVGNYGEVFERNLGRETPLGLSRGANALWSNGGLLYAAPFR